MMLSAERVEDTAVGFLPVGLLQTHFGADGKIERIQTAWILAWVVLKILWELMGAFLQQTAALNDSTEYDEKTPS